MSRLVVLGDSLCFHGPDQPVPLAEPRLYPNVAARALARASGAPWEAVVVAQAGWSLRELWRALQKDVHLQQQVLLGADAVVLGVGSMDSLPVGLPRVVADALPHLRPTRLRRAVRHRLDRAHPSLVRLSRARLRWTPASVQEHAWPKCVDAVRLFSGGAPLVAVLPPPHRAGYYAGRQPWQADVRERYVRLGRARSVALVDLDPLVRPHLAGFNPDGLHWGWAAHAAVGEALATTLAPQVAAAPDHGATTLAAARDVASHSAGS